MPPDSADCGLHVPAPGEFVYVDELPERILAVPPAYPDSARDAGVQGLVLVEALVCSSGMIFETRVIQSIPMLDQAAVTAIRQWLFEPARVNKEPVAVWVAIPIRFTLHAPEAPNVRLMPIVKLD